jgi:hypothetical protein
MMTPSTAIAAQQLLLLKRTTMNRQLQTASIALEDDDDSMSLLFPYSILAIVGLVCVGFAFRYAYSWVCRVYFGRIVFAEPVEPLSGEEILANLSDDQRREVMQAILSKVCKVRCDPPRQVASLCCCAVLLVALIAAHCTESSIVDPLTLLTSHIFGSFPSFHRQLLFLISTIAKKANKGAAATLKQKRICP